MSQSPPYKIVLLKSVNQTMWADKILKKKGIPHKLIPIPRHLSHDCGVCIRVESEFSEQVNRELCAVIKDFQIVPLVPA